MLDNLPQLLSPVTTPDIYHVRPIRLDCDACDAPSGEEHRWATHDAYADYCNYGSRYGRESIILGCAERVRKLVYYVLKEGEVHRKRYHTVGPDLFGAGLLAIVKAASDPAKFRPVGQGSEEVVYCDRTGEIWEGGDDEITAIRKYLKTVAERAMWGEFKRVSSSRLPRQYPHTHPDRRAGLPLSSPCSPSRANHSLGQLPRSPPSGFRGWAGRWFLAIPSSATSSHQRNSHEPHPQ